MAVDAAFEAERMHREQHEDQQRIMDLASLAERRYAACDPDNRLIAAQLEKNWEAALRRVRDLETRQPAERPSDVKVDRAPSPIWRTIYRRRGMRRVLRCVPPATAADIDHRDRRRCR